VHADTEQLAGIEGIAMDVGTLHFDSVLVDGKNKVVLYKYHIASYLSERWIRSLLPPSVESSHLEGRRRLLRTARNIEPRPEARAL